MLTIRNCIFAVGPVLVLATLGCSKASKPEAAATGTSASASSAPGSATNAPAAKASDEQTYPMRAEVMGLNPSNHMATLKHDTIDGFMAAMTMGYQVKDPAEFDKLKVGDKITATLHVSADAMWIGDIQKAEAPAKP
jgi:Cu/Ag efflux protein CusF